MPWCNRRVRVRPKPGRKRETHERRRDRLPLRPGRHLRRSQCLRPREDLGLSEVNDVEGRLVGGEQGLDRLVQRGSPVLEAQRHRSGRRAHERHRPPRSPRQALLDRPRVPEGRRHEDELRLCQLEERDLPRPAPVGIPVVVELVHHDLVDGRVRPVRSAMFATISAVAQTTGAEALIEASPVSMPTFSAPRWLQSAKNFSETSALMGAV